jgi:hypothetical protein
MLKLKDFKDKLIPLKTDPKFDNSHIDELQIRGGADRYTRMWDVYTTVDGPGNEPDSYALDAKVVGSDWR